MIISLSKITKYYNGETVLDNVSLNVEDNDRIGLVGINGSGKSTLLRIITGLENPETHSYPNEPQIYKNKNAVIGYLAQNSGLENDNRIYAQMRSVFKSLDDTSKRLRDIELEMSEIEDHDSNAYRQLSIEYSRLTAYYETNDGYLIDIKISKVLNGLGFSPNIYDRVISTLSGGEKTRLAIAKLLLENPNLLILDEPTNHLDFKTIIWLEDYLKDYKGALLIVSHDRYFLDRLCNSICEIERGCLRRFKGNYSAYTKEKKLLIQKQLKDYEAQQREKHKLQDYVARNIVRASTSNMAKSRVKRLESMEMIEKPVLYEKSAKIKFQYDIVPPLEILNIHDIDITVGKGEKSVTLIKSLSFSVRRGEKIGIVGSNGIGKSTILKVIQHILPIHKGRIEWANNVRISYFDQENTRFSMNDTVIEAIHKKFPMMKELEIRSLLGSVLLTGEDVFKQVGVISGGERAKLCFALMKLEHGNVLILDEPTNHLDIATREVIETALCDFDGTVIFVSHDRYLLNELSTRVFEVADNHLKIYNSGFDKYIEAKRIESAQEKSESDNYEKPEKTNRISNYRTKEQRAEDARKRQRIKELEAEIERLECEVLRIEAELTDPKVCADYILAEEKYGELVSAKNLLNDFTDQWLAIDL